MKPALILGLACGVAACSDAPVELGFWMEPVSYTSARLGDPISPQELAMIESVAREQIIAAFDGFDVIVSGNRRARYRVRVVQRLREERFRREAHVAGESRGMAGFGGSGAVSFEYLASGAVVFAPEMASRAEVTEALGRGIGRVAIHEFLHQLLPKFPLHDSRDSRSYEGNSPALREGYFEDLHWGIAEPWLEKQVGRR